MPHKIALNGFGMQVVSNETGLLIRYTSEFEPISEEKQ